MTLNILSDKTFFRQQKGRLFKAALLKTSITSN